MSQRRHRFSSFLGLLAAACLCAVEGMSSLGCGPKTPTEAPVVSPNEPSGDSSRLGYKDVLGAATGVDDPTLALLLVEHWDAQMVSSPLLATTRGDHRFDDKLGDNSDAAIRRELDQAKSLLARAKGIDFSSLSARDVVTLKLFTSSIENSIGSASCVSHLWEVSAFSNPIASANRIPELHRVDSTTDADNLLARYRQISTMIDRSIANLRIGASRNLYANAESVRRVLKQIDAVLETPIEKWALMGPVSPEKLAALPAERQSGWALEVRKTIDVDVRAAFQRFRHFVASDVAAKARGPKVVGVGSLPIGAACYAAQINRHLGVSRSAEELHELGLAQVAAVNTEMRELGFKLFKTNDFSKITTRLRTDPTLYYETAEEIVADASKALAAAKASMDKSFGLQPKADCIVTPIPDYEAPFSTIAYYRQPHKDGSVPGQYFINTFKPTIRPRFEMRVLSFHEAIPGHHLQIAISQERDQLPAFRRHLGSTAFVEGWALYTERLADEMGLYETDLDRMGMLSYDAWRASRLVVDTGIHHKGWTREAAEEFLREHTALTGGNISNEVDRYISWPGQALAYKYGQLEIMRLRRHAEQMLGGGFELKGFHDVVLGGGAVTLPILAENVEAWIGSQKTP